MLTSINYNDLPEAKLIVLARSGDDTAFEALVIKRQSLVRNFMNYLCNNPDLADDLAQTVFLKAWQALPKLKKVEAFGGWLKHIAVNVWKQYCRDDLSKSNLQSPLEDSQSEGEYLPLDDEKMDLNKALAQLGTDARLCIVLSYEWGMSHQEISASTNLPLGTVKSHIKRGLLNLESMLSAHSQHNPSINTGE